MRRPPFTMKTLENLEDLVGFAEVEIADHELDHWGADTKPARAAIEWIAAMRRWKTEQNEKPIEIPVPPGNPSD